MRPDCIYYITVLIYCCVLTVYNILYKFVLQNGMASVRFYGEELVLEQLECLKISPAFFVKFEGF